MLKTSVTIFVCLSSHVRRICVYLPAPVCKSAPRSNYEYCYVEKRKDEKTLSQAAFGFLCVSR